MIILTRLGGQQVAVNPDLIERAEQTPDTVITMVDGHKLVVAESVEDVVTAVRSWRASVAAQAYGMSHAGADADMQGGIDRATEIASDDVAAHSVLGSSLARVLRMPPRED